jgi:hypothetical protein
MDDILKKLTPEARKTALELPMTVGDMLHAVAPITDEIKVMRERDPDALLESTLMTRADVIGKSLRNYCDDLSYGRSEFIGKSVEVKSWHR